jgi:hypothetical protein
MSLLIRVRYYCQQLELLPVFMETRLLPGQVQLNEVRLIMHEVLTRSTSCGVILFLEHKVMPVKFIYFLFQAQATSQKVTFVCSKSAKT